MTAWTSKETSSRIADYLVQLFDALGLEATQTSSPTSPLLASREQLTEATRRLQGQLQHLDRLICPHARETKVLQQQRATLHILAESSLRLLHIAHQWPRSRFEASERFLSYCEQRPSAKLDYDQLYCSPDSTERRCLRILSELPEQGRILLLGDDDLTSLALADQHRGPIDVIEYDTRLLQHIQDHAPEVSCYAIDLFLGALPKNFAQSFDAIVLDPPWDDYHAWCFLHKAHLALRDAPQARIYMAFCPLNLAWLERKAARFWKRFAQVGLAIESIDTTWHLYPLQGTEFMSLLLRHCPQVESPLLQTLRHLPFGFSDLYTLRPIQGFRMNFWRRSLQRWWHLGSQRAAHHLLASSAAKDATR